MKKPVVVITGASSGIGKALAILFASKNYPLGLIARNMQAMHALDLTHAISAAADVTKYHEMSNAIELIEKQLGPIDCLINNAGFAKAGDFTDLTNEEHETTIDVNVLGIVHGIQCVLPGMQSRKKGTIINVSSIADRNSRPNIASYAASKAAVKSLSESLRQANAKHGIRVCNVAPAKILTPMLMTANLHPEDAIAPEDLAKAILWIYEQPQSICIRDMVVAPTVYEA